jgi:hypothetical protein
MRLGQTYGGKSPSRALGCALAALLASAPAAAANEGAGGDFGRVAVVQIDAPGMLPAAREQLEDEVRNGLAAAGVDVQAGATTSGHVEDAVAAGLSCSLVEETCALKVAVAADVASVVVGRVVGVGAERAIELRLASLDGARRSLASRQAPAAVARRLITGSPAPANDTLPVPLTLSPADAVDAVVVVDGAEQPHKSGTLWLTPGKHRVVVRAAGFDDHVVDVDVDGSHLPAPLSVSLASGFPLLSAVGLVAAGGGVVVAAMGGLLALGAEDALATGVKFDDREGFRVIGQAALVAAGLGAATAIAGGAVATVGFLE